MPSPTPRSRRGLSLRTPFVCAAALITALLVNGGDGRWPPVPAARAQEAAPGDPPRTPEADDADERLPIDEARDLLDRAQRNLRLHGQSLQPVYLRRALADFRRVFDGLPDRGIPDDVRFDSGFALAFALIRAEMPADPQARGVVLREIDAALGRAAAINPDFPGIALLRGITHIESGLVRQDMRVPETLENGLGEVSEALDHLEQVTGLAGWQLDHLRLFGRFARGRAFLDPRFGRAELALEEFEAVMVIARRLARDPLTPRDERLEAALLPYVAAAQQALDFFDAAAKTLDHLIAIDPGNALHLYNRGLIAAWQARYDEALKWYRKAADKAPEDPRPRLKIAYILLKYGPDGQPDIEGALLQADAHERIVGEVTAETAACRGEAAFLRGDLAGAERWFRRALERHPDCREALNKMVQILGRRSGRSPEEDAELLDFKERLQRLTRERQQGDGMEPVRPEVTFC